MCRSLVVLILLLVATQPMIHDKFQQLIPFDHLGYDPKVALALSCILFLFFYLFRGRCERTCRCGCGDNCKCREGYEEGFFFEVSDSGRRKCNGLYNGKPTSFQYTTVGSGDCQPESYPPLGMIGNVQQCTIGTPIQPPPY